MKSVSFRNAIQSDTPVLFSLINSAYRGDSARSGWTNEADLVGGLRVTEEEISSIISTPDQSFLLALYGEEIVGCVHLKFILGEVQINMLTIHPEKQNQKIGASLFSEIERLARLSAKSAMTLSVIHVRKELIAYYERKGFVLTGQSEPFPPQYPAKIPGLLLLEMKKTL